MTAERFNAATIETLTPSHTDSTTRLSSLTSGLQVWAPLVIGSFCLIQGLWFVQAAEPMVNLAGLALCMSVPSCLYFAWRGYRLSTQPTPKPGFELDNNGK
jgi:hypothetical protein